MRQVSSSVAAEPGGNADRLAGAAGGAGRLMIVEDERITALARLGGDEFVIIAECPQRNLDAPHLAERLLAALQEPVSVNGACIVARASIAIAHYPDDGSPGEALLHAADAAMYAAKQRGRADVVTYRAGLPPRAPGPLHDDLRKSGVPQ